jgi:uncharacterized protein (DUF433 family)
MAIVLQWLQSERLYSPSEGMMIKPWDTLDAVERHPDIVSGAWVFRGTRVPVAALFENLRDGATIDQFLEWFPGVSRAQVEAVLNYEVQTLMTAAAA